MIAIRDQERAGLDIITDGDSGAKAIPTASPPRSKAWTSKIPAPRSIARASPIPVPRVTGKIRRKHPVEVRDLQFLRANTDGAVKMTVPGPFTMSQQAQNEFYKDERGDGARLRGGGE